MRSDEYKSFSNLTPEELDEVRRIAEAEAVPLTTEHSNGIQSHSPAKSSSTLERSYLDIIYKIAIILGIAFLVEREITKEPQSETTSSDQQRVKLLESEVSKIRSLLENEIEQRIRTENRAVQTSRNEDTDRLKPQEKTPLPGRNDWNVIDLPKPSPPTPPETGIEEIEKIIVTGSRIRKADQYHGFDNGLDNGINPPSDNGMIETETIPSEKKKDSEPKAMVQTPASTSVPTTISSEESTEEENQQAPYPTPQIGPYIIPKKESLNPEKEDDGLDSDTLSSKRLQKMRELFKYFMQKNKIKKSSSPKKEIKRARTLDELLHNPPLFIVRDSSRRRERGFPRFG
ncbi:MAG: hypothetical protein U1C97_00670 [Candidatus Gracilibacteria bacterium]|nr:hypothetical protein [Candidatus Gracilibacteria bacterium]